LKDSFWLTIESPIPLSTEAGFERLSSCMTSDQIHSNA